MMKYVLSSPMVKIFGKDDAVNITAGQCLSNQSFSYQIVLSSDDALTGLSVTVDSDLGAKVFLVKKSKGDYVGHLTKTDDYYLHPEDDMYPELLVECGTVDVGRGEPTVLFVDVPADEKKPGLHTLTVTVGDEKIPFDLTVTDALLLPTDLLLTNWFHLDGICNYYGLKPFSEEFYARFEQYLDAYVKMGNTMILVPMVTPPLDTGVGHERLTTQLLGVTDHGNGRYSFDFSETERFMSLCEKKGIRYFEICQIFSQWGGEFSPKVVATDAATGKEKRIFGWENGSESEEYLNFLDQYLAAFMEFLEKTGRKENSYMHLTDEPNTEHIEKYTRLAEFVKARNRGIPTIDALSHFAFVEKGGIDMPVVCMTSGELPLFANVPHMIYYCVGTDQNYATNRYFHMPLQRTEILGFQLYANHVQGFLQWGYNFYNTCLSLATIDPYKDATSGDRFPAGDAFIVYPGQKNVEYSLRYFALLRAFEDYRLMLTLEAKIGREACDDMLREAGINGVHEYPRSVEAHEALRNKIIAALA